VPRDQGRDGRHGRHAARDDAGERPARRPSQPAEGRGRRRRVAVVYDIDGPRVRLGIGWFVLAVAGLAVGPIGVAAVYGVTAGLAGAQAARAWRKARRGEGPDDVAAAACAIALPVAAVVSTGALGIAILAVVAACLLTGGLGAGVRTLQCGIWPGAAAAAVVVSDQFEPWSAAALVLAVSAYEIGDFLVGTGARNAVEGPVAGAAAVLVVQFGVSAVGLPPFELPDGLGFAVAAAVLCPIGQLVASLVLPSADAPASALRRLDSLLVLAPLWAWWAGLAASAPPG
jgi:hypothetical protein